MEQSTPSKSPCEELDETQRKEYLATYAAVMLPEKFNGTSMQVSLSVEYLNEQVEFRGVKRAKEDSFYQKALVRLVKDKYKHVIREDFRMLGFTHEDLKPYLK